MSLWDKYADWADSQRSKRDKQNKELSELTDAELKEKAIKTRGDMFSGNIYEDEYRRRQRVRARLDKKEDIIL